MLVKGVAGRQDTVELLLLLTVEVSGILNSFCRLMSTDHRKRSHNHEKIHM